MRVPATWLIITEGVKARIWRADGRTEAIRGMPSWEGKEKAKDDVNWVVERENTAYLLAEPL
eukprot:COSAG05_NODE_2152_length_3472_cov_3.475245_4_plen_62_part_00